MPCCDLWVTMVLPSASTCMAQLVQLRAAAGSFSHERLIALGKAFELCKCKRRLLDEEKLGSSQRDFQNV